MRKFGKRLFSAVVAAALISTMSLTAFAAPSASTDGAVKDVIEATDKDNKDVKVEVVEITNAEEKAAAEEVKKTATVKEILKDKFVEGMKTVDVREVRVVGDESLVKWPITITFKVPGVVETTKVAVLHYVDGAWKVEPSKAGKGTITATFDSLSPVAFIVDENTAVDPKAPPMGENAMVTVVALVAIVAAAGAVVLKKRDIAR